VWRPRCARTRRRIGDRVFCVASIIASMEHVANGPEDAAIS